MEGRPRDARIISPCRASEMVSSLRFREYKEILVLAAKARSPVDAKSDSRANDKDRDMNLAMLNHLSLDFQALILVHVVDS